ncbi:MAG: UDP-N-acetylmuramate--L-alanine ligase [Acidimicrobiales bacterium]
MTDDVHLGEPRAIHIVGIGGAGMRAIASVLSAMGHKVSGSDLKPSPAIDRLRAQGVDASVGHRASNVVGVELLTRSTAVPNSNPEVVAASEQGIPVWSRAEMLAAITRVRPTISVAGTHGKTTTASMLAVILREGRLDPSFIIGGQVNEVGSGAVWAATEGWFVVEADESDGTFVELDSQLGIVTSVEPDHLSHYGSEADLRRAFDEFVAGVSGTTFVCADDQGARSLAVHPDVVTYGVSPDSDWVVSGYSSRRMGASFELRSPTGGEVEIELTTPGLHNVLNAAAAVAAASTAGTSLEAAQRALRRFGGVARRFQLRGERDGVTYIDDYAHLPSEVTAALEAAKAGDWNRIICVFQPHRYTRTRDLWRDFATAFEGADSVLVTDIYGAGETPLPGVSGELVVESVLAVEPHASISFVADRGDLVATLHDQLIAGDLCLTLGAGDLTTLPDEMLVP